MKKATFFYFLVNAFAIVYGIGISAVNSPQWQVLWIYQYSGCALGIAIYIILYLVAPSQIVPKEITVSRILFSNANLLMYYMMFQLVLASCSNNPTQLELVFSAGAVTIFQCYAIYNYLMIRNIELPTTD